MRRVGERVAVRDVEVLEVDVVEEHVDAGEVVGREVDLLTEVAPPDLLMIAEHRAELQQQAA